VRAKWTEKPIETAAKAVVRPRVFLEEIDKFKASEYKLIRRFEIVNAIYEAKGKIVATSNTSVDEVAAAWARSTARRPCGASARSLKE
jgi:predicted ATPase